MIRLEHPDLDDYAETLREKKSVRDPGTGEWLFLNNDHLIECIEACDPNLRPSDAMIEELLDFINDGVGPQAFAYDFQAKPHMLQEIDLITAALMIDQAREWVLTPQGRFHVAGVRNKELENLASVK